MKKDKFVTSTPTGSGQALRRHAEEKLRASEAATPEVLSAEETKQLLHEFRVHQIELEMQNEELRRAQNELELSRSRYFDLYNLAPVGYLTLSGQGLIEEINLAAATMLGVERGELVNQPISRIIFKDDQDIYYLHRKRLLETDESQACELRLVKVDGTVFWAYLEASAERDICASPGQDPDGTLVLHVVLSDITERKRTQEALLETNRKLIEATALAREMAAKSEASNQVKSQFLANMSHELRTPMTGVLGMLDLAIDGPLEAEQREFIEIAQTSARSLVRILNDILELTKIEAGKLLIENKPFSLRTCMENCFNIFISVAKVKGLDFYFTVADDVPRNLVGDQTRLSQVLTNLAGNAVKFTKKGAVAIVVVAGGISLGGKREVTFIVTDTGIGIPKDKMDKLFRNFSQVDESHTREYGGTGLGLAISKEIVELMGGTIGFKCTEGKGCSFTFTIPFVEAETECDDIHETMKTVTALDVSHAEEITKPRLLIAEDDPTIRQILGTMLQRSNYEVCFAENGRIAVDMWEAGKFDLILMDIQMPLMNGFEATAAIREKENSRGGHIPIVAVTTHASKDVEKRCLTAGMDAFISKPIDLKKILQLIGDIIKQKPGGVC